MAPFNLLTNFQLYKSHYKIHKGEYFSKIDEYYNDIIKYHKFVNSHIIILKRPFFRQMKVEV